MKALLLAAATLAAVGCSSEPSAAVRVPAHKTSPEGETAGSSRAYPLDPSGEPTTTTEAPTTTVAPTTTTEPEPVATTVPYVAPVTTRRATTTTAYEPPAPQGRTTGRGTEPPAGDVPPDYIKQCESGGNYQAVNPNGHYGAFQFSQATWDSTAVRAGRSDLVGVRPDRASVASQDQLAAVLWDNGRGASHWECA